MGFKTYTCPIAKSCGGCEWLAVPYPIQLRRKREAVVELFEDVLDGAVVCDASSAAGGGARGAHGGAGGSSSAGSATGSAGRGVVASRGEIDASAKTRSAYPLNRETLLQPGVNERGAADGAARKSGRAGGHNAHGDDQARIVPIHGMKKPAHYRHKAATPFAPGTRGTVRSGFYARGSHRIVPCSDCLVEAVGARKALNAVARAAEELRIPAYAEDRGRGLLRHAVVRAGYATDECLLTLVTNGNGIAREREFVDRIRERAPFVTAVAQNINQRRTNAILGRETRALFGKGRMRDKLLGCTFEIGPTSFYQTNPEQTEVLYSLAIDGAGLQPGMRVLDAYCGIGTIGMCAAKRVGGLEVVGIEQIEGAVADARRNAAINELEDSCRFICADATAYMRDARRDRNGFDVVLMDPPRAGSTPEFLDGVIGLAPEHVVYVSCNPVTQRRDVEQLLEGGYRIDRLDVVDMFPHTKHAETVMVLRRR